jgi:hypothetical protein
VERLAVANPALPSLRGQQLAGSVLDALTIGEATPLTLGL